MFVDDGWAEVELFRWQYGELPQAGDKRKVDYHLATEIMANNVAEGAVSPFNAGSVIAYLGRRVARLQEAKPC